ncbi:hypothetical protein GCM10010269_22060 [Streptomyces humidus]|uniref:Uncharacterized protein n=1 Tax=Streptomyces humidus TaxID=52259 RepID=A0A918L2U0_9ACTN|nr:hypothetical protein GCM10010269_22060 [Streptomyces humidus]
MFATVGAGVVLVEHGDDDGAGAGGGSRRECGGAASHRSSSGGLCEAAGRSVWPREGGVTERASRLASFLVKEMCVAPGVRFRDRASVRNVAEAVAAAFLDVATAVQGVVLGGGPGGGCGTPGAVRSPGQSPAEGEAEQGDGGSENEGVHLVSPTG